MLEVRSRQDLHERITAWKRAGELVALVPTMGNLHAGHLALVREARNLADRVVTSIYVNPTQFGQGEDFGKYPRTLDADLAALEREGCDLVFMPDDKVVYPFGPGKTMLLKAPGELAGMLEGASRSGHFDGVVTVVSRLFNMVAPDIAVFGEKDYQQLVIIKHMVEDLAYPIRIHGLAVVRDDSGLALSSRNTFLDPEQKEAAALLNVVLSEIADALAVGREDLAELEAGAVKRLSEHGLRPDYVAIRRSDNLLEPSAGDQSLRVLAAVWCGETRLIDNRNAMRVCINGE